MHTRGLVFTIDCGFPYARTRAPIEHLPEIGRLMGLFDQTHPQHFYRVEPQAQTYTITGDLWDYLYDRYREQRPQGVFIPFTLEMGSWLWIKKNPRQLTSRAGPFNPLRPHREQRIRRRHFTLFEFLRRSLGSTEAWLSPPEDRSQHRQQAFARWYAHDAR
jgi:hypothetical protein